MITITVVKRMAPRHWRIRIQGQKLSYEWLPRWFDELDEAWKMAFRCARIFQRDDDITMFFVDAHYNQICKMTFTKNIEPGKLRTNPYCGLTREQYKQIKQQRRIDD